MAAETTTTRHFDHAAWTGQCECGGVCFDICGPMRAITQCGCKQCRRACSTNASFAGAYNRDLQFTESGGLTWYRSSPGAQRGFCHRCGSTLFYKRDENDHADGRIAIAAGVLNEPVGLPVAAAIFAEFAQPHDAFHPDAPIFDIVYPDDFVVPWYDAPNTPRSNDRNS